jgi:hypothetical protein
VVVRFEGLSAGIAMHRKQVASIQRLAIPTHERFDRFILGKAERVIEPRGGCMAARLRATS